MKKFCCLILSIFIETCCMCCNFCDAGSKKYEIRNSHNRKVKKDKQKFKYRQKKELEMFANFWASEKSDLEKTSEV